MSIRVSQNNIKGDILVVDDTPHNLRLLSSILSARGYKVRPVIHSPMALTAARLSPPDLILLDINMPEMDGYEVCRQLKADQKTAAIPVLFISAMGEVLDKVKAFSVGGVDYITKPFQVEEVIVRVENHLVLHHLRQQLQEANTALSQSNQELERRVAERTAELVDLNRAYECFVPHEFLSLLHKEQIIDVELGDQVQQEMTVLFADIRAFTTLSEGMTPQENFNFINAYLRRVSPVIRTHQGFIDKYIGDAIMALFPYQVEDALHAAIAMQSEVAHYNLELAAQGHPHITIGIGLHTGLLMLGIIGEEQRKQGTVIADAVNVAARLEELTKVYGASIIISEQMLRHLQEPARYNIRFVDTVQVRGKHEPVSVFEIFDGEPQQIVALKLQTKDTFEEGLHFYQCKNFAQASVCFNSVLERDPQDKAARIYLERSAYYMVHGVPPDWVGIKAPEIER
jgi:two-component system sensor histidine kinase ChiS